MSISSSVPEALRIIFLALEDPQEKSARWCADDVSFEISDEDGFAQYYNLRRRRQGGAETKFSSIKKSFTNYGIFHCEGVANGAKRYHRSDAATRGDGGEDPSSGEERRRASLQRQLRRAAQAGAVAAGTLAPPPPVVSQLNGLTSYFARGRPDLLVFVDSKRKSTAGTAAAAAAAATAAPSANTIAANTFATAAAPIASASSAASGAGKKHGHRRSRDESFADSHCGRSTIDRSSVDRRSSSIDVGDCSSSSSSSSSSQDDQITDDNYCDDDDDDGDITLTYYGRAAAPNRKRARLAPATSEPPLLDQESVEALRAAAAAAPMWRNVSNFLATFVPEDVRRHFLDSDGQIDVTKIPDAMLTATTTTTTMTTTMMASSSSSSSSSQPQQPQQPHQPQQQQQPSPPPPSPPSFLSQPSPPFAAATDPHSLAHTTTTTATTTTTTTSTTTPINSFTTGCGDGDLNLPTLPSPVPDVELEMDATPDSPGHARGGLLESESDRDTGASRGVLHSFLGMDTMPFESAGDFFDGMSGDFVGADDDPNGINSYNSYNGHDNGNNTGFNFTSNPGSATANDSSEQWVSSCLDSLVPESTGVTAVLNTVKQQDRAGTWNATWTLLWLFLLLALVGAAAATWIEYAPASAARTVRTMGLCGVFGRFDESLADVCALDSLPAAMGFQS
jgi:hypothetical protein